MKAVLVVQHNHLIEANFSLTLQEQRIILWLVSQVNPDDMDFKEHIIKVSDLCKYAGLKSKNMHKEIKNIAHSLLNNILHIQHSPNHWVKVAWLSSAEYLDGTIKLCFSPKLRPYLLELKECFTPLELSTLMQFKSTYSLRLFELLKQYQKVGMREFSLSDLRNKLGIMDEEYALYSNFKKKVLCIAQNEINRKSDIRINFDEIKEWKRVTAIKFFIETQQTKDCDTLLRSAKDLGISKSALDKFLMQYSQEEVLHGLSIMRAYADPINSPVQFLKKALAENWQPSVVEGSLNTAAFELTVEREIEALFESVECKAIRKSFVKQRGEKEYKAWLYSAEMELENTVLKVRVKSVFLAHYIQTHYIHVLKDATKGVEHVEVLVKTDNGSSNEKQMNKTVSIKPEPEKKSVASTKRKGETTKKQDQDNELPKLKQLTLWERIKTFLNPGYGS